MEIDQDFRLLFGDSTSAKLLEKWSTNIKPKVIAQSRGLTQTGELQDLIQNAVATEVEEGNYNSYADMPNAQVITVGNLNQWWW